MKATGRVLLECYTHNMNLIVFPKLTIQNLTWKLYTWVQRARLERGFKDKDLIREDSLLTEGKDHHLKVFSTADMFPDSRDKTGIDLEIRDAWRCDQSRTPIKASLPSSFLRCIG